MADRVNFICAMTSGVVTFAGFDCDVSIYDRDIDAFKKDTLYELDYDSKIPYIKHFSSRNCELKDLRKTITDIISAEKVNNVWLYDVDKKQWYHSKFSDTKFVKFS